MYATIIDIYFYTSKPYSLKAHEHAYTPPPQTVTDALSQTRFVELTLPCLSKGK